MQKKKRTTIKDIAEAAGVSLGTVHLALNNKKGIRGETKEKVLQVARQLEYQPNYAASMLKRKTLHIVGCFPDVSGDNRFYYPQVWRGFLDAAEDASRNFPQLEWQACVYDAFGEGEGNSSPDISGRMRNRISVEELLGRLENGEIDGLVTDGNNFLFPDNLPRYTKLGTAVALTDTDVPDSGRITCVCADYDMIGRTMAEIIMDRIPPFGSIFMCAGIEKFRSHYGIEHGFDAFMRENHYDNRIYKEHSNQISEENYEAVLNYVRQPDIAAVCCVSSRSSVMMKRALIESGKAGKVVAIGSDLFAENNDALRRGIFQNLIQKNPYAQSWLATKYLLEYLTKDIRPKEVNTIGCGVIYRSTLPYYEKQHILFNY